MTTQVKPTVFDATLQRIRPLTTDEQVEVGSIPVSPQEGNELQVKADGLYYGRYALPPTIYLDTATGTDDIAAVIENPTTAKLKTLGYALSQVAAYRPQAVRLALKSGQSYSLPEPMTIDSCDLSITVYDDPIYGFAEGYLGASLIINCAHTNFQRAVINTVADLDPSTGCWYLNNLKLRHSTLTMHGLQLDIPAAPPNGSLADNAYAVTSNLFTVDTSKVEIVGCIANKLSHDSKFGLFGFMSGSTSMYRQLSSRFLSMGLTLNSADPALVLAMANRRYFHKMMADVPSSHTLSENYSMEASGTGSLLPTGLLDLYWGVSYGGVDPVNSANYQATFPATDTSYGLRNYFYGIQRDQQNRAMNVRSSFLL